MIFPPGTQKNPHERPETLAANGTPFFLCGSGWVSDGSIKETRILPTNYKRETTCYQMVIAFLHLLFLRWFVQSKRKQLKTNAAQNKKRRPHQSNWASSYAHKERLWRRLRKVGFEQKHTRNGWDGGRDEGMESLGNFFWALQASRKRRLRDDFGTPK